MTLTLFKRGDPNPEKTVTLPLTTLPISLSLLPTSVKMFLQEEEIDLAGCREQLKEKNVRGTLIEIEAPQKERTIALHGAS